MRLHRRYDALYRRFEALDTDVKVGLTLVALLALGFCLMLLVDRRLKACPGAEPPDAIGECERILGIDRPDAVYTASIACRSWSESVVASPDTPPPEHYRLRCGYVRNMSKATKTFYVPMGYAPDCPDAYGCRAYG
jgi:hypothetical protein